MAGLHDHHIHLLATAARLHSVDLSGMINAGEIAAALQSKAVTLAPGDWLRAVGYDERVAGLPGRKILDQWVADRPLRLQDRTGALWVLNSAGLAQIGGAPWPSSVEVDGTGQPTGRIWRGDDWLRSRIGNAPPSLGGLSRQLARWGVTSVTDAGAHNGPAEAAILGKAVRDGELYQRLTMMGREDLPAAPDYKVGAVKLLFDERALPEIETIAARILAARGLGRPVAAHCVTEGELVTYLAALDLAGGAQAGDRIEHGSMIPESLIADLANAHLIVVTNPGFIEARGDRYLAEIDQQDMLNFQRLGSLSSAGVRIFASSDAPYGPTNPWVVIRCALRRMTLSGAFIGKREAVSAQAALALYSGENRVCIGANADCCLVDSGWAEHIMQTDEPNPVHLTLIGGRHRIIP